VCVFDHINGDRQNLGFNDSPDPKTWNDPLLRNAENFAAANDPTALP